MMDDIDRDCCSAVEAMMMRGLGLRDDDWSNNSDGRWKVVDRKFHDPGMTLYLQHAHGPKVTVDISYNWR